MLEPELKLLPVGTSSFAALRDFGQIYVDKTDLIGELAGRRGKFLFVRPRRFGKSLLISTFEELFSSGEKQFEGLNIYGFWKDKKYTVIHLDFSLIREIGLSKNFEAQFKDFLYHRFCTAGFSQNENVDFHYFLQKLSTWLKKQPPNSIVILIDEYDAPLTYVLDQANLFNSIDALLAQFYAIIKSNDSAIRFLFITGITKFKTAKIFSVLNNLTDISLSSRYATLVGFSREEIARCFLPFMQRSALRLGLTLSELERKLARHYGGYSFHLRGRRPVFPPWSVLNFLSSPDMGFANYWVESGGNPRALLKYVQSGVLEDPQEFNQEYAVSLSELDGVFIGGKINEISLLVQTGYLSIKRKELNAVFVGYPNQEVEISMANLFLDQLLRNKTLPAIGAGGIWKELSAGNAAQAIELFNKIFAAIPCEYYRSATEGFICSIMHVALSSVDADVHAAVRNILGRNCLEVLTPTCRWLIDVKLARNDVSEDELLDAGIKQTLERHCSESSDGSAFQRVVLLFSNKERQITAWKKCC